MSGDRRGFAAVLVLVTVLSALVAYVALVYLGLGPCEGDGGGPVPGACGALWLVFPVAPLVVAGGAGFAYSLRRPWPMGLGMTLALAGGAIPYMLITR